MFNAYVMYPGLRVTPSSFRSREVMPTKDSLRVKLQLDKADQEGVVQ